MSTRPDRQLSIGEFAAATQLSPKALRIYDEQRLLLPARIDGATGYRYYGSEQVPLGRLIRTLREMNLSLTEIADVISAKDGRAQTLLARLAQEIDERHARERRAYHTALVQLGEPVRSDAPEIVECARPDTTAAIRPFTANRYDFVEKFRAEARALRALLEQAGLAGEEASCALIDPLSDEESRLEVVMPIDPPARIPNGVTLRRLPAAACAAIATNVRHAHASELTGALDALFDWFDRRGSRALDAPLVSIEAGISGLRTRIVWAFEQAPPAR